MAEHEQGPRVSSRTGLRHLLLSDVLLPVSVVRNVNERCVFMCVCVCLCGGGRAAKCKWMHRRARCAGPAWCADIRAKDTRSTRSVCALSWICAQPRTHLRPLIGAHAHTTTARLLLLHTRTHACKITIARTMHSAEQQQSGTTTTTTPTRMACAVGVCHSEFETGNMSRALTRRLLDLVIVRVKEKERHDDVLSRWCRLRLRG